MRTPMEKKQDRVRRRDYQRLVALSLGRVRSEEVSLRR